MTIKSLPVNSEESFSLNLLATVHCRQNVSQYN